jgi:hypothetical protein
MTGTIRQVVRQAPAAAARVRPRAGAAAPAAASAPSADQVKLTAIIADASGKKITAVIMDGERSFSVDPGDMVAGRKITRITNDGIYMESDTMMYFYDIYGNLVTKSKESGTVSSVSKEDKEQKPEPKTRPPAGKR